MKRVTHILTVLAVIPVIVAFYTLVLLGAAIWSLGEALSSRFQPDRPASEAH